LPIVLGLAVGGARAALAADIEVIFTEVVTSASSLVPGARDAAGLPTEARFLSIVDLSISHDGSQWVIRGTTNQPIGLNNILILGSGLAGSAFCQAGQPVQGGQPNELYDFFDSPNPAAWNENGLLAYSFRAKNGSASVAEKVVTFSGGVHTIVHQQGDPALGIIDNPPTASGDEAFGNSMSSIHLLNDGRAAFVNSPIQGCNSSRYPALFRGNTSFIQCGVTTVAGEVWDNLVFANCGGSPDGQHWYAEGDTELLDNAHDYVFAVDGQVIVRENTVIPKTSIIVADGFAARMLSNGEWMVRGDDTSNNDWVLRNGVLAAQTGASVIQPPLNPIENWGTNINTIAPNRVGDWIIAGDTSNVNLTINGVMVLNGTELLAREGDWIDLNGDGIQNDNAFLNTFRTAWLTDNRLVYFLATLKNQQGINIGDALLRIDASLPCPADIAPIGPPPPDGDDTVNVQDLLAVIGAWGACANPNDCPADIAPAPSGDDTVDVQDLLAVIGAWGACP